MGELDIQNKIHELNREYHIDIQKRVILITGEIEEFLLEDIITKTNIIQTYSNKKNVNDAITWQISSYGGDVYEMFSLIDYIRTSPIKINTFVTGKAMSAASMILVSGTGVRRASKYSTIMFHESSGLSAGKFSDQKAGMAHSEKMEDWACEILADKTNHDANWWKLKQKTDTFFTPTEALEIGAIDEII